MISLLRESNQKEDKLTDNIIILKNQFFHFLSMWIIFTEIMLCNNKMSGKEIYHVPKYKIMF